MQPRAHHKDGPVRRASYSPMEILDWWGDIEKASAETDKPDAPLTAGDWCRFCPAAAICDTRKAHALEVARMEFLDDPVPDVQRYAPADLAWTLSNLERLEQWCKSVRTFAEGEANHGRMPPGFKFVNTRATHKWLNPDEAPKGLRKYGMDEADIYAKKLLSVAQIEKKIGKKNIKDIGHLYDKKSGGVVLVPVDDPRPAIADAASEFSEEKKEVPNVFE